MKEQRKTELQGILDEAEELRRQVNLQLKEDHPKYQDQGAWEQAVGALSDKLSDILTEERDDLETEAWMDPKETPEHADLTEIVIHMEHALNHCNAALDSIEEKDFEQARTELDDLIHQIKKSMDA